MRILKNKLDFFSEIIRIAKTVLVSNLPLYIITDKEDLKIMALPRVDFPTS